MTKLFLTALLLTVVASAAEPATRHAKGTFSVKVTPATTQYVVRLLLDKEYQGDLTGKAKGEMLTPSADVTDTGVYVAIETVQAKLDGREGTFALHHTGIMDKGKQDLQINIAPGSGTGGLKGITGRLLITIADGKHYYDLEYAIP